MLPAAFCTSLRRERRKMCPVQARPKDRETNVSVSERNVKYSYYACFSSSSCYKQLSSGPEVHAGHDRSRSRVSVVQKERSIFQ